MVYLALEDILSIRDRIAAAYRDSIEIMNFHGLLSALATPRQSAFGAEAFPTMVDKAAVLVYLLIQNHPFWDGNKRIAAAALVTFLQRNGVRLAATDAELKTFTIRIARGALRDGAIAAWIGDHIKTAG